MSATKIHSSKRLRWVRYTQETEQNRTEGLAGKIEDMARSAGLDINLRASSKIIPLLLLVVCAVCVSIAGPTLPGLSGNSMSHARGLRSTDETRSSSDAPPSSLRDSKANLFDVPDVPITESRDDGTGSRAAESDSRPPEEDESAATLGDTKERIIDRIEEVTTGATSATASDATDTDTDVDLDGSESSEDAKVVWTELDGPSEEPVLQDSDDSDAPPPSLLDEEEESDADMLNPLSHVVTEAHRAKFTEVARTLDEQHSKLGIQQALESCIKALFEDEQATYAHVLQCIDQERHKLDAREQALVQQLERNNREMAGTGRAEPRTPLKAAAIETLLDSESDGSSDSAPESVKNPPAGGDGPINPLLGLNRQVAQHKATAGESDEEHRERGASADGAAPVPKQPALGGRANTAPAHLGVYAHSDEEAHSETGSMVIEGDDESTPLARTGLDEPSVLEVGESSTASTATTTRGEREEGVLGHGVAQGVNFEEDGVGPSE